MSEPRQEAEQPVAAPTVSTAPAPSLANRWWSAIPSHVGPARLSTVVLALLFLAIGALYLQVRPDPVPPATAGGGGVVQTTTPARTPEAPTTATPTSTEAPPTTATPTTTEPLPTTEPTDTTTEPVPEPTSDSGFPTSTLPPSPETASTSASPPG
jgi:cytoskeletal protein RodZ